ncbi:MFS transporter [Actinomadura sp. DC4]|uniref:MFS transporter n=1 Tax=Actinomadura sp. DC4 TaxID=3055069 RepID=UPI0025B0E73C|nr:MFS transporter [Actinomadura sp. DC4]MDN3354501.1 MFS transporter [Actinomadura sp. DC4]
MLPRSAKALLGIRVLNQIGAFAFSFLAVLAGPRLVTAVLTVFGATALVSRWAGGVLLDRAAPRTLVVLGLGATGLALLALAAARTPWQVLTAVAATGLAFEIYEPATSELLARVTEGQDRQDAYALLGMALAAAGAVSGLLAAVLLPFGVRPLLVADAVTCLAAAAVARTCLPRGSVPTRMTVRWRPPRRLVRLTAGATAYAFGYLAILMFTPFVLLQRGAPAWLPGLTLAAAALLAPMARRPLSGHPRPALLASGVFALAMAVTPSVPLTVAAYVAWAMAGSALLGYWPALAAEDAPPLDRPRWFAFLGLSWGVAQPVVPVVVGAAGALTGRTAAASLAAAVAFAAAAW